VFNEGRGVERKRSNAGDATSIDLLLLPPHPLPARKLDWDISFVLLHTISPRICFTVEQLYVNPLSSAWLLSHARHAPQTRCDHALKKLPTCARQHLDVERLGIIVSYVPVYSQLTLDLASRWPEGCIPLVSYLVGRDLRCSCTD
jgi:hypothetical protein